MPPMRLSHLNLRVRDAGACRAFYEDHFGFRLAFEADGGFFLRDQHQFLLAVIPVDRHQALPPGFHLGFTLADAEAVVARHAEFGAVMAVGPLEDERPDEAYVSFRCWDPDGTEIEVFWDGV